MSRLRIGFAGTPEFAGSVLDSLLTARDSDSPIELVVVYTQPDRPAGRNRILKSSPVKQRAIARSLPVQTPTSLKGVEAQATLDSYHLDALVVAAYGLLLPPAILETPRFGCLNVHASLLPRWRGAAPIERCLMAGDNTTGVSIMLMDQGLDTGPVLAQKEIVITERTTGGELHDQMASLGGKALLECLTNIETLTPIAQDNSLATLAPKLKAEDSHIDWRNSARYIDAQIRALAYRAPAFTTLDGERVRFLKASAAKDSMTAEYPPGALVKVSQQEIRVACGEGALLCEQLGLSRGKGKPLDPKALLNGYPNLLTIGAQFDPFKSRHTQ